jgi:threonine/homoserine/homoserine lactone efflux protein
MSAALLSGLLVGALAAANVGPIWLLCARTSARFGFLPGAGIGAGAAAVDLSYAILGALGAAALLRADVLRVGLGLVGAGVLVWLGLRTLQAAFRIRLGAEDEVEVVRPQAAFRTGLVATASNPLTILTWGAVFSGAAVADVAAGPSAATAFVIGIGLGSLGFHLVLAGVMSAVGPRLGTRGLQAVDAVAGLGLMAFGGVLGYRTLADR